MLNIIMLVVTTIFIPVFVFVSLALYPNLNKRKMTVGLAIAMLSLELLRFFYNASLYGDNKAITPAKNVMFSFITFFTVFALFAVFNKGKFGKFMSKAVVMTALVPMVYAIFSTRVYINEIDKFFVIPACYYAESGIAVTLALLLLRENGEQNIKKVLLSTLYAVLIWGCYIGIKIGTNAFWKLEIPYDLNFYLGAFIPLAAIALSSAGYFLYSKFLLERQKLI